MRSKLGLSGLVLIGTVIGYFIGDRILDLRVICFGLHRSKLSDEKIREEIPRQHKQQMYYTDRNLAFLGVMTSKEFLTSRAIAVNGTWAKIFPGKLMFFTPEDIGDVYLPGIDVVPLKGVTDVYPPQKKSFLMLKYMHDMYLNDFRFFIRADDDVFVNVDKLTKFLHSVATDHLVIGIAGWGKQEKVGKIGLVGDGNYCQGGPGMIFPREILRRTGPMVQFCLKNLCSRHEDVELGRCVRRAANGSCTSAYQKFFYQNYRDYTGAFNHSLTDDPDIDNAFTLHPVKMTPFMFRLNQHFLNNKLRRLYGRQQAISREVVAMNRLLEHSIAPILDVFETYSSNINPRIIDDIRLWLFVNDSHFSPYSFQPKRQLGADERDATKNTANEVLDLLLNRRQIDREVKSKDITFLYSRKDALHGLDYIFQLRKTVRDSRRKKVNKYSRFYAHRPFQPIKMQEDDRTSSMPQIGDTVKLNETRVNVVVPLVRRHSTFLQFLKNFEEQFLKTKQNVSLLINMLANGTVDAGPDATISHMDRLQQNYRDIPLNVNLLEGDLSSGKALQIVVQTFRDDDLIFFTDIDVNFKIPTLQRIRFNTVLGESVYMPIFFSKFVPNTFPGILLKSETSSSLPFDSETGYWRSYGAVSCFKSDFARASGYNSDVEGSVLEEHNILEKFIAAGIAIIRSADVDLTRVLPPVNCDKNVSKIQYDMCLETKRTSVASVETMTDYVYRTPAIFKRSQPK